MISAYFISSLSTLLAHDKYPKVIWVWHTYIEAIKEMLAQAMIKYLAII